MAPEMGSGSKQSGIRTSLVFVANLRSQVNKLEEIKLWDIYKKMDSCIMVITVMRLHENILGLAVELVGISSRQRQQDVAINSRKGRTLDSSTPTFWEPMEPNPPPTSETQTIFSSS